jgi:hypothetical protein
LPEVCLGAYTWAEVATKMKRKIFLALGAVLILLLLVSGAAYWHHFNLTLKEAQATDMLIQARGDLQSGRQADALEKARTAAKLHSTALVLLAAGEIARDANELTLARGLLGSALVQSHSSDVKLQDAIKRSLDAVADANSAAPKVSNAK